MRKEWDYYDMLDGEDDNANKERIEKLEKKVAALQSAFIGALLGHFIGNLLFP